MKKKSWPQEKQNEEEIQEDLCNLIKSWLGEHGWEYIENKDFIEAHNESQRWVINVQGDQTGKKTDTAGEAERGLKHIEDTNTHYSIAFNDSVSYRRQWNEIPKAVKNSLNMSVILADKKGNITEL